MLVPRRYPRRMELRRKLHKFADSFQCKVQQESFYHGVWTYMKIGSLLGQLPIALSSDKNIKVTKLSTAYFLSLFAVFNSFALFSNLTAEHDHLHMKNPMILRVALFQVFTLSVTAVIGAVNMFYKRQDLVEVTCC